MALKSARIYVSGTNLWTYAPYYKGDPEVGIGSGETQGASVVPGEFALYSYPTTSSISLGVIIERTKIDIEIIEAIIQLLPFLLILPAKIITNEVKMI